MSASAHTKTSGLLGRSLWIALLSLVLFQPFLQNGIAAESTPLPSPVNNALAQAENEELLAISYTMAFNWPDTEKIITRYDAITKKWTLISGSPKALNKNGLKHFKTYKRLESKPGGLLYNDYRSSLKQVYLQSDDAQETVYSFISTLTPKKMAKSEDKIETILAIDKTNNHIKRYAIKVGTPFSPFPLSSLNEFVFDQTFERPFEGAPALLTSFHWRAKGKKALRKIDEDFSIQFSDFEIH